MNRKITFTRLLNDGDLADLRGIDVTTHQFQRWAPKQYDARVIAVGDQLFAFAIHAGNTTSYIDFRTDYDALSYEPIGLPGKVSEGIRQFLDAMGLVYGALDFVVDPEETYTFLECNAGGQFGVARSAHRRAGHGSHRRPVDHGRIVTEWTTLAAALADKLTTAGKLRSPEWQAALRAVPRHELVPVHYMMNPRTDAWTAENTADDLRRVYSNTALFALPAGLSSTSMPGLMTRMLETLDIHDGHRVLEIGTGTGYNAALLCHRFGDEHVFSVDIEAELVELARQRLARLGHHPTLVIADGANGLPEHAPYDRIIATCSVPAVPWPWVQHIRDDGRILLDLKIRPAGRQPGAAPAARRHRRGTIRSHLRQLHGHP